jgi:hypothetical protein
VFIDSTIVVVRLRVYSTNSGDQAPSVVLVVIRLRVDTKIHAITDLYLLLPAIGSQPQQ